MSSMYDRDDTGWEAMRDASRNLLEQAWQRGIADAAQDLWDQLREAGVGSGWSGGYIVAAVEQWLLDHGVDTSDPEPYCNHDPAAVRNGTCECGTYVQDDGDNSPAMIRDRMADDLAARKISRPAASACACPCCRERRER